VILSADQVRAYKTSPSTYGLGPQTLGCPAANIFFISSNGWDASCATWYGYRTCWVNRNGAPAERLGAAPNVVGRTLEVATDFLHKELQPAA
jgi:2-haloacid dehalogenase